MNHITKHVSLEAFNGTKAELARPHVALIHEGDKKILAYSQSGEFHAHEQGKAPILDIEPVPAPIALYLNVETFEIDREEAITTPLTPDGEHLVVMMFDPAYDNVIDITIGDGDAQLSFNGSVSDCSYISLVGEELLNDAPFLQPWSGKLMLMIESGWFSLNSVSVKRFPARGSVNANGHEFVDLGLPSGRLWAKCNIGAESAEQYGLYFPWAGTQGYANAQQHTFDFTTGNTPYCEGDGWMLDKVNKYNNGAGGYAGNIDNLFALLPEDDAAHVNMGGDWRMPSMYDFMELDAYTTSEWTEQNGVSGRLFTSKQNGNTLFIPAAGYCKGSSVYVQGSYGFCWSRSLYAGNAYDALILYFSSDNVNPQDDYYRYSGYSVRGVL